MPAQATGRRARLAGPLVVALLWSFLVVAGSGHAWAEPTAGFTYGPSAPAVGEVVTFTSTGTCDVAACRTTWTWYAPGARLGTAMGEGPVVHYRFATSGTRSVVMAITSGRVGARATATRSVVVHETFQDNSRRVGYNTWRGVVSAAASSGGHRLGSGTASMPFSGTTVTYVGLTGPAQGIAAVAVDGAPSRSVDLYSATPGTRATSFTGLAAGAHRISVRPTGKKNPASTGTDVSLDEFVDGTGRVDDTHHRAMYDSWASYLNPAASGGSYRRSATAGAGTTLAFRGTAVTWLAGTGPDQGLARITVDGAVVRTVDTYSAVRQWRVPQAVFGLAAGDHTVSVTVVGTRTASSTGIGVISDAFTVS